MSTDYNEYEDFNSIDDDEEFEDFINSPMGQLYLKFQENIQIIELKKQIQQLKDQIEKIENENEQIRNENQQIRNENQTIQQQLIKHSRSTNNHKST